MPPLVLLVDDDALLLQILEMNFRFAGFDVRSTGRGDRAVEEALAARPDAVVLDVGLPGMDGREVCRRLREHEELARVPVIFLSGRASDDVSEPGYALGVTEHVMKPFDPQDLVELVRLRVAGERPEREA